MKNVGILKVMCSLLLVWPQTPFASNIIFDLGDVLIETHYLQSMLHIGPVTMASYALTLKNPFACHITLFNFLHDIKPLTETFHLKDTHGNILPQIMCEWLKGTLPATAILEHIDNHHHKCGTWMEYLLLRSLAQAIFVPEIFVQSRIIVPEGFNFVKACKKAGHNLYILSNWDPESFDLLRKMYPDFFDLFDGILISGEVQVIKPNPLIYELFLERFGLIAHECIFIDDVLENVLAAQKQGITGIHYQKKAGFFFSVPDFQNVCEKINRFEATKEIPLFVSEQWC